MRFSLNREKGITLIIVTHDEELAQKCSRRIRITDGQIVTDKDTVAKHNKKLIEDSDNDGMLDKSHIKEIEVEEE